MTQASSSSERISGVKQQILATFLANICCLAQGCAVGWLSPSLPLLLANESPLAEGAISVEAAAWIGAILPLGVTTGVLFFGFLSNYIGSKRSLLLTAFPVLIHWIVIRIADEAWIIIVARFLSGLTGGGVFINIPLFVAEIANERVRGQLSSLLQLSFNFGIVLGYIAGMFSDYFTLPLIMIGLPVVFVGLFIWLPDTPQFLLQIQNKEKAEKSLRFYRNIKDEKDVIKEVQLQQELEKFVQIAQQNADQPPVRLADFMNRATIRGMLIGTTLLAIAQFSGTFTLSNYAKIIFRESGSQLDPNMSSVIMGSLQCVGTICASTLIDRLGRKRLLLISYAGSSVSLAITGCYAYLNTCTDHDLSAWNVLPVLSLSFFIFISAVGLTPVPYVLIAELLPQRVRRIGATICTCTVGLYTFVILRFFPLMLVHLQLHGCMWCFATVSAVGFVFAAIVVEETKGMNLDQLQATDAKTDKNGLA